MISNLYAAINKRPLSDIEFKYLSAGIDSSKLKKIISNNKHNADNSIIGIVLAKKAINETFSIPLDEINICYEQSGRPFIEDHSEIHVSISHSNDLVVCAVSNCEIGIDVEKIRQYNPKLANKYFSNKEIEIICSSYNKDKEFTKIWTQKEAALKCTGLGISKLLDTDYFKDFDYHTTEFDDYVITLATKITEL